MQKAYQQATTEIEKLQQEVGLPYLCVIAYQKHKEIFRYASHLETGREKLQMYSCSKPVTAVAALRLVERGCLSLEDKVVDYLPELRDCFIMDEQGTKKMVGEQMTVRHLFSMQSGFDYEILNSSAVKEFAKSTNGKGSLRESLASFVSSPLLFIPGERFCYGISHDILASVVEVVSGQRYSEFVKKEIFVPLGMSDSTFENKIEETYPMYAATAEKEIKKRGSNDNSLLPTLAYESGGAGLISSLEDSILFTDALACGSAENGYCLLGEWGMKALTEEQITFDDPLFYGLGVRVWRRATEYGVSKGAFGWDGAAGSYFLVDPAKEISIVIGSSVLGWPHVFRGGHFKIWDSIYKNIVKDEVK